MNYENGSELNLGQLIDRLSIMNPNVVLNLGGAHSYRGFYEDLAFQNVPGNTVKDLLKEAKEALSMPFMGWKGGEYRMTRNTTCWIAHPGDLGRPMVASDLGTNQPEDPTVLWCAVINLNGIFTDEPMKMKKNDRGAFWDSTGSWMADQPGLTVEDNFVQYVSADREQVKLFLTGACAFQYLVKNLCWMDETKILKPKVKKAKKGARNA